MTTRHRVTQIVVTLGDLRIPPEALLRAIEEVVSGASVAVSAEAWRRAGDVVDQYLKTQRSMEMALLTKEQILAAQDITTEDVEVPEWGGTVRVQTMTGEARDDFEYQVYLNKEGATGKQRVRNVRAKFLAMSIVDEQGNLIFNEEQIKALGKKSYRALDRVFSAASRLSALSAADVDELAKNSEAGPSADGMSA